LGDETTTTEFTTEANTAWDGEASRTGDTTEASDFKKLTAWGPEANTSTTTAQLGLNGIRTEEDETNTIVEETIKGFWRVVNDLPQIKVDMQNIETQDGPSIGTLPFFCSFLRLSLMTSDSDTSDSPTTTNALTRSPISPPARLPTPQTHIPSTTSTPAQASPSKQPSHPTRTPPPLPDIDTLSLVDPPPN
jgi:hypothetical protein